MDFKTRFLQLLEERNMSQADFAKEFGLSKSGVTTWLSRNCSPKKEVLEKMATYFDCSIDYLLGRTDVRYVIHQSKVGDREVIYIGDLNEKQKEFLIDFVRKYKKSI